MRFERDKPEWWMVVLMAVLVALPARARAQEPSEPKPAPVVVPFEMLASNHMVVDVKLNGRGPYTLIFDVGSPVTLLGNRAAKGAGLIKEGNTFPLLFGARGAEEVEKLEVGGLVAKDVPVLIMDHPVVGALGRILGRPLDGLMGHTFFARYRTTIDYQAKTMAFEPVDHEIRDLFAELPDRLMGPKKARKVIVEPTGVMGVRVKEGEKDGVRVTDVLASSAASEAGVEPGDLILGLDGRWVTSLADLYRAASELEPGHPIELEIERAGAPRRLTMTPRAGF